VPQATPAIEDGLTVIVTLTTLKGVGVGVGVLAKAVAVVLAYPWVTAV